MYNCIQDGQGSGWEVHYYSSTGQSYVLCDLCSNVNLGLPNAATHVVYSVYIMLECRTLLCMEYIRYAI